MSLVADANRIIKNTNIKGAVSVHLSTFRLISCTVPAWSAIGSRFLDLHMHTDYSFRLFIPMSSFYSGVPQAYE